jgi:hypothetical protein
MESLNKTFIEFLIEHEIPFEMENDTHIAVDPQYLLPFEIEIRKEFPQFKMYPPDIQQQQANG